MPWTKSNYPNAMENLRIDVKNKAIEIANALLKEKHMDEGIVIATAISRAKDWAANRGKAITKKNATVRQVDVKKHGADTYVTPAKDGWHVKKERSKKSQSFDTKKEAIAVAKQEAKKANASITIQRKDGKLEKKISYNPNKRGTKQGMKRS